MASIEWRHDRKILHLPTVFMPGYQSDNALAATRVEALLDTGATATGIHPSIIDELSFRKKGQRRVNTANGLIIAAEYVVRIGFVCGDHTDPDFNAVSQKPYMIEREIVAFGLQSGFPHAALIGMDILGYGDLTLTRDGRARFVFE